MFRFLWNRTAGNVEQEAAKRLAETKLMKDLAAMARGLIHGDVYNPADPRTHHLYVPLFPLLSVCNDTS